MVRNVAEHVIGRAYVKGVGMHYVEAGASKDFFTLRHIGTGECRFMHRDRIQWR